MDSLKLDQFPPDRWHELALDDQATPWLQSLLCEVAADLPLADHHFLRPNLALNRTASMSYGELLLLKCQLHGRYPAACVRCLKNITAKLQLDFQGAFLMEPQQHGDSIVVEGEEYDLYFYHRGRVDLPAFVCEQVHMARDPFPLHDPDCRGLCPICGTDLNVQDCRHKTPKKNLALQA